ncbi:DUF721 domain-containing protein [Amorphus orientalis]|uniref:DUF721 domain-containing protein n=1 Tax=Amorphus orientalis TaxID=649198 RepID=A0AAE4AR91_9HYPH|nr:DciA family protein [Amorphus orientalis]MDQ0313947.1 hypothetical protein [Amorphus orientalis]
MAVTPRQDPRRRKASRRAVPLADLIGDALTPAARKRGFASAALLTQWDSIVDEKIARGSVPERLIWPRRAKDDPDHAGGATLVLAADAGAALIVQHTTPQLIERLNAFFGWRAIERIKIVQRPIPARKAAPKPPVALSAEQETALAEQLAVMPDSPLKTALARLGRGVMAAGATDADGQRAPFSGRATET